MSGVSLVDALVNAPVMAPLDVRFANGERGDDGPALFFGQPNVMALEIVNRTLHDMPYINAGDDYHLELAFRPHTLLEPENVRLAKASIADGWTLLTYNPDGHGHRQVFRLHRKAKEVLAAQATDYVHLEEVRANSFGGARGTQASVNYAGIGLAHDHSPLSGHLLLRLALLDAGDRANGTIGHDKENGDDLFRVRFDNGGTTLLTGGALNTFRIGICNQSGETLTLQGGDDTAARFSFDLGAAKHHGAIEFSIDNNEHGVAEGWESIVSNLNIAVQPSARYSWAHGKFLWFAVKMTCNIDHGQFPMRILYENMPPEGQRGGHITMLQTYGPIAQTKSISYSNKPLDLIGPDGAVHFSSGDLNSNKKTAARLFASQDTITEGKLTIESTSEHGIVVESKSLSLKGDVNAKSINVTDTSDVALSTGSGYGLSVGNLSGLHVLMDSNEVMARNGTKASPFHLNAEGGEITLGERSNLHIRVEGNEVNPYQGNSRNTLKIRGKADITGDASIGGKADVHGDASIGGRADITGDAIVGGSADITHDATVGGNADVRGKLSAKSINVTDTRDVGLSTGSGYGLSVGNLSGVHLLVDSNEIMARSGKKASTLYLNAEGGEIFFGNRKGKHLRMSGATIRAFDSSDSRQHLRVESNTFIDGQLSVTDVGPSGDDDKELILTKDFVICYDSSSKRYKKDIKVLKDDFEALMKVKPRSFRMKNGFGNPEVEHIGYIAEELDTVGLERLVNYDEEGRPESIKYKKLSIYLTEIVKKQEKRIAALEAAVAKLAQTPETSNAAKKVTKRKAGSAKKHGA